MYYQIVSFNYKKCSLEQREAVAFKDKKEIKHFLNTLTDFDFILEAFVVNTCNRVEIVVASHDNFATYHAILGILSKSKGLNFYELEKSALRYDENDAIEHFFNVVASLDSMVVGEAQITGQVKEAFRLSYKNKTAGKELNRLLSYASKCAADVRTSTEISEQVIGSGDMGKLASKHLLRAGADVLIVSRNIEHAQALADELGENIKVGSYDKLEIYINKYRLLFSATRSKEPIITKAMVEDKPIDRLWFDMAIPRDISSDIKFDNLKIYFIDDLQEISKNNHALRKEQALIASDIVKKYKEEFLLWLQTLSVEPVIKNMRLTKFLHMPTKRLREVSKESEGTVTINALKEIFNINTDSVDPIKYKKESK